MTKYYSIKNGKLVPAISNEIKFWSIAGIMFILGIIFGHAWSIAQQIDAYFYKW